MVITIIGIIFKCSFKLNTGTGDTEHTDNMDTTFKSQIENTLTSNVEFEFSLDFQGQCEYVESKDTDQFLERELVVLFLVDKGLIPINERTEGIVKCLPLDNEWMGIVYISYKTCTQVGSDWDEDVWDEGTSERLVSTLLGE